MSSVSRSPSNLIGISFHLNDDIFDDQAHTTLDLHKSLLHTGINTDRCRSNVNENR